MTNKGQLDLLDQWLTQGELVKLPSGKQARLRQVDALSLMDDEGALSNLFMGQIARHMNPDAKPDSQPATVAESGVELKLSDLRASIPMLNRVCKAAFIEPAIVDTQAAFEAGQGILPEHIAIMDKMSVFSWAIGGRQALDSTRFLQQSRDTVGDVSKGHSTQNKTKR